MSAASDDRMVLALSKFSKGKGKAKAKGTGGATAAQQKQKRDASTRTSLMKRSDCPAYVKEKWDSIVNMSGKDGMKNKEKSKFTDMLIKDAGTWEDMYWQVTVEKSTTSKKAWNGNGSCVARQKRITEVEKRAS